MTAREIGGRNEDRTRATKEREEIRGKKREWI